MNIYLDIDGVLLANDLNTANYAPEFIEYVLTNYPDTTYWLTTHCWRGENRAIEVLSPHLDSTTVELLHKVKPTVWVERKTDAIDFSQPFLWFDDDLYEGEKEILQNHGALDSWVEVDLRQDPDQLQKFITSFPIPTVEVLPESDPKQ